MLSTARLAAAGNPVGALQGVTPILTSVSISATLGCIVGMHGMHSATRTVHQC